MSVEDLASSEERFFLMGTNEDNEPSNFLKSTNDMYINDTASQENDQDNQITENGVFTPERPVTNEDM